MEVSGEQRLLISKSWISYLWDGVPASLQCTSFMPSASVDSRVHEGERPPVFHQAGPVAAHRRASSSHGVAGALVLFPWQKLSAVGLRVKGQERSHTDSIKQSDCQKGVDGCTPERGENHS